MVNKYDLTILIQIMLSLSLSISRGDPEKLVWVWGRGPSPYKKSDVSFSSSVFFPQFRVYFYRIIYNPWNKQLWGPTVNIMTNSEYDQ